MSPPLPLPADLEEIHPGTPVLQPGTGVNGEVFRSRCSAGSVGPGTSGLIRQEVAVVALGQPRSPPRWHPRQPCCAVPGSAARPGTGAGHLRVRKRNGARPGAHPCHYLCPPAPGPGGSGAVTGARRSLPALGSLCPPARRRRELFQRETWRNRGTGPAAVGERQAGVARGRPAAPRCSAARKGRTCSLLVLVGFGLSQCCVRPPIVAVSAAGAAEQGCRSVFGRRGR